MILTQNKSSQVPSVQEVAIISIIMEMSIQDMRIQAISILKIVQLYTLICVE